MFTRPLNYLALGDSYTIGEAVDATARWPAVLVRRMREAGADMGEPQIVAVTGWTTDELARGMDEARPGPAQDLVTLQIGVNNQYRGRPLDEYATQFDELLSRAVGLAGAEASRVVVVSIPDWGVTRFARENGHDAARIATELDAFNARARELAEGRGAGFVYITGLSRQCPTLVAQDGLHPSAAQYAAWVEEILPAALRAVHGAT